MNDIQVPGTAPAPAVPQGFNLSVGVFLILLGGFFAWLATATGDPSLWALAASFIVIIAAFFGSKVLTLVGRAGRIRLTRRKGSWAAVESRSGQLLLLTASILALLISAGFIITLPTAHIGVWLFGLLAPLGIAESSMKLRNPAGWYFNEDTVMVVVARKIPTAFTWNEVERVELKGRVVAVTGRGQTVENPGDDVASDPAVVARVIEFYRSNPRSRPELSDDRFLERLRSGQL